MVPDGHSVFAPTPTSLLIREIELRNGVSYDVSRSSRLRREEHASCFRAGLEWRELVKLFKKPKSKFYWYDFTVRGRRYRGSTQETKADKASQVAGLKLAQVVVGTDPLPKKPSTLAESSERFLTWITDGRLES